MPYCRQMQQRPSRPLANRPSRLFKYNNQQLDRPASSTTTVASRRGRGPTQSASCYSGTMDLSELLLLRWRAHYQHPRASTPNTPSRHLINRSSPLTHMSSALHCSSVKQQTLPHTSFSLLSQPRRRQPWLLDLPRSRSLPHSHQLLQRSGWLLGTSAKLLVHTQQSANQLASLFHHGSDNTNLAPAYLPLVRIARRFSSGRIHRVSARFTSSIDSHDQHPHTSSLSSPSCHPATGTLPRHTRHPHSRHLCALTASTAAGMAHGHTTILKSAP